MNNDGWPREAKENGSRGARKYPGSNRAEKSAMRERALSLLTTSPLRNIH